MQATPVNAVLGHPGGEGDPEGRAVTGPEPFLPERGERVGDTRDTVIAGHAVHAERDFLAAPPRDDVVGAEGRAEHRGEPLQHPVAHRMPVPVVDPLEPVEIEQREGQRQVGLAGGGLEALHLVLELAPVRQPGERVGFGERLIQPDAIEPIPDAGTQLGSPHRLGHVVVGAGREHLLDGMRVGSGGEDEHRQPGPPVVTADETAQLDTGDVRHVDVEEHEVGPGPFQHLPETHRLGEGRQPQGVVREDGMQRRQDGGIVVDGEQSRHSPLAAVKRGGQCGRQTVGRQ